MSDPIEPGRQVERILLIVALAVFLFATPLVYWWASDDSPWYVVYLLWCAIIAFGAWIWEGPEDEPPPQLMILPTKNSVKIA